MRRCSRFIPLLVVAAVVPLSAAGTAFAMHRESSARPLTVKPVLAALRVQRLGHHRFAVATTLPTWANDYPWLDDSSQGYVGIHHDTTAPDGAWGFETNLGGDPGLWLYPIGDQRYTPGQAEFTYTAPGTTRLLSASLDIAYRNKVLAHHCLNVGFRTGDEIVDSNDHCQPVHPPDSQAEVHVDLADPNANPISKVLYFQLAMPPCESGPCEKQIPALDPLKNGGYARLKSLRMVLVDDDTPGLLPEGELWDIRDTYINGSRAYDLITNANDQGSGVARAWVERVGAGSIASGNAPCDPTHNTAELDNRICPATYSFTASIATSSFPEGAQQFVEKAADVADNVGESPTWTVYIDRTPPPAATDLAVSAYDSQAQTTTVSWTAGDDPPLADGNPGSGVQSFSYRYNLNGAGWTDWSDTGEPDFQIENTALGDSIDVEVKSVDGAGNVSPVTSATLTVFAADGPSDPYGSTTPDPGSTLSLTDAQQADAIQIAQSDPAVHALIGDQTTVASDVGPWSAPSGAVVGAELTLSWDAPISVSGDWPFVDLSSDGVTYQPATRTYSVSNLTQLDVVVDFGRGRVVSITPGVDAVVSPASAQPLALATKRFTAGGGLALRRLVAGTNATPVQEGAVNLRRITTKLYPALKGDAFWNWDFGGRQASISPFSPGAARTADMPVTLIFWQNADTITAKDLFNRGQSPIGREFADWMHNFVQDRPDHDPNNFNNEEPADHTTGPSGVYASVDQGSYQGKAGLQVACRYATLKVHYRVYGPGPDNIGFYRFWSPALSFYVVGTSHLDKDERCPGGVSGWPNAAENIVAGAATNHTTQTVDLIGRCHTLSDPWEIITNKGQNGHDAVRLYNEDHRYLVRNHFYFNDGKATMIRIEATSHPHWHCTITP